MELTIVLTVVLFILFSFVFGIMVLYQHVFLQKAVNTAILTVTEMQGFSGSIDEYNAKISEEFEKEMNKSMFGHDNVKLAFSRESGIAEDISHVEAVQSVSLPLNFMKDFLSDTGYMKIRASSSFIADNTVQNIRNVDLVIEIYDRLKGKVKDILKGNDEE